MDYPNGAPFNNYPTYFQPQQMLPPGNGMRAVMPVSQFEQYVQMVVSNNQNVINHAPIAPGKPTFHINADGSYYHSSQMLPPPFYGAPHHQSPAEKWYWITKTMFDSMVNDHRNLAYQHQVLLSKHTELQMEMNVLRNRPKKARKLANSNANKNNAEEQRQSDLSVDQVSQPFPGFENLPLDAYEIYDSILNPSKKAAKLILKGMQPGWVNDLRKLTGNEWLNDSVIHNYLLLIRNKSEENAHLLNVYCFTMFLMPTYEANGFERVKKWTTRKNIFTFDLIFMPLLVNSNHWVLVTVFVQEKTIRLYNSLPETFPAPLGKLASVLSYLKDEWEHKRGAPFKIAEWRLEVPTDIPKQENTFDCGVFVCQFAERLSRNEPLNFTQNDMPYFRKRMIYELVKSALLSPA